MNLTFLMDGRKCIGCHACTVACKSEHDIPIGVNRTWDKYVESGQFPNSKRMFSVLRCNHCEDAPCIDICPTNSLHYLDSGIVDFDTDRCIGCKSCMQACPYDALYINPETHVAEKCNFCAHRLERGLEPACVIVCPVEAIVFGDIEDSSSYISELIAKENVTVRKPEKGTIPKVFYLEGDDASLNPTETKITDDYMSSEQYKGVGHFAKYAEERSSEKDPNDLLIQLAIEAGAKYEGSGNSQEILDRLRSDDSRTVYDSPSKGILWGWEVSAYVWTKSISAGLFFMLMLSELFGWVNVSDGLMESSLWTSMAFLMITGGLLVKDLDQPKRFLYVLLRPQWKSWLVKGAYFISVFGFITSILLLNLYVDLGVGIGIFKVAGGIFAMLSAVYTSFLFAQAKGRDFWQSSVAPFQMIIHSAIAGSMMIGILGGEFTSEMISVIAALLGINLVLFVKELTGSDKTSDTKAVVDLITKGRYKMQFLLTIVFGRVLPLLLLLLAPGLVPVQLLGVVVLIGILSSEHIWVRAPQLISLS